jgi:hypothetical protein
VYSTDRLKRFYIGERTFYLAATRLLRPVEFVQSAREIPEDCRVERVYHDWTRLPPQFCIVISHPSFDPVPMGEEIPIVIPMWFTEREPDEQPAFSITVPTK